jgi:hypothetical protein
MLCPPRYPHPKTHSLPTFPKRLPRRILQTSHLLLLFFFNIAHSTESTYRPHAPHALHPSYFSPSPSSSRSPQTLNNLTLHIVFFLFFLHLRSPCDHRSVGIHGLGGISGDRGACRRFPLRTPRGHFDVELALRGGAPLDGPSRRGRSGC